MFRSVEKFVLRNISLWNLLKEAAKYGILKKIVCDLGVRAHKLGKVRRFKMLQAIRIKITKYSEVIKDRQISFET